MRGIRIIAALAAVAGLAFAAAATAGASKKSCPDGRMCVWTKANYEGKRLVLGKHRGVSNRIYGYQGDPEGDPAGPFNDNVSSLKVRKSGFGVLYANVNGDGDARCFDDQHRNVRDLADPAWNFDNSASSSAIPKEDPPCGARKSGSRAKAGSGCPADTLCLWSRTAYRGQRVKIAKLNGVSNKLARVMNNDASSLKNKFDVGGFLYDLKNAGGDSLEICPLAKSAALGVTAFNNRASSSRMGLDVRRRGC